MRYLNAVSLPRPGHLWVCAATAAVLLSACSKPEPPPEPVRAELPPLNHVEAAMRAEGLSTAFLRRVEGPNGLARVTHDAAGDRVFLGSNRGGIRRKLMLRMDDDDLAAIRPLNAA